MTNLANTQTVLTFDGVNDYIDFGRNDIGGVFAQGISAFTVSGWINPHELTNKATSYGTRNVFFARSSERYSDNFEFGISETGSLDVYIDETVSKSIKTFGKGELTIGEWHFFAIVFKSGEITVYLDDRVYTDSLKGSSLNKATSSVTLGATLHKQVYFKGQLANISVWNYSCTQVQIQIQYCGLIVGDEEGLVAYWKLDDGQGTTVKNQIGKSYQGNFRGNPTWELAEIPFATQSFNPVPFAAPSSNQENIQEEIQIETPVIPEENISTLTTSLLAATVPLISVKEDELQEIQQTQITTEESEFVPTLITLKSYDEETKTEQIEDSVNVQQAQTLTQEEPPETMNTKAQPKYKILSIDGGGIRGIIPAFILAEIERRTQKPIFSLFDLIAGTSSGGILALGLTKPRLNYDVSNLPLAQYTAEDLLQLFLEYGIEIFYEPLFERILGPIEDIFLQPKYPSESKKEILRQYFEQAPLESNLKEVFVTSYDIEQRIPIFFTNKLEKEEKKSQKFRKLCAGFSLIEFLEASNNGKSVKKFPISHKIDYSQLQTLLAQYKWKEADIETAKLMLQVMGKNYWNEVYKEDILNFSCQAFYTIDGLWQQYSHGYFGFSVQQSIWNEIGAQVDYETEKRLGDRLGWRKEGNWLDYNQLSFKLSPTTPMGHLPVKWLHYDQDVFDLPPSSAEPLSMGAWRVGSWLVWQMHLFFSRVQICNEIHKLIIKN